MRTPGDKKAKTIRLGPDSASRLENVSRLTKKSESSIVEDALCEYFKNHGYNTRYVMGANSNCYVLIKQQGEQFFVLDQQIRNGIPIEIVRDKYAAKYNSPVELLLEQETDK